MAGDERQYIYDDFPSRMAVGDIDKILSHCQEAGGIDDLYLTSERIIYAKAHKRLHPVTARRVSDTEVSAVMREVYGDNAVSECQRRGYIDYAYQPRDGSRFRYRFNAQKIRTQRQATSYAVALRSIPTDPPTMDDLRVAAEIRTGFEQLQGLVLVSGPTGSGKSTLLAAALRDRLERVGCADVVITIEEPIEFIYDKVSTSGLVMQSEVGPHVASFADGLRSGLRRHPDVILVGELRDRETIEVAIEAALTGHLVFATTHSNGVLETVRRMVSPFGETERPAKMADLLAALRFVVTQRLEKNPSGGRTAIWEWLMFDAEIRKVLFETPGERFNEVLTSFVEAKGRKLITSSEDAFRRGLISEETYLQYQSGQ